MTTATRDYSAPQRIEQDFVQAAARVNFTKVVASRIETSLVYQCYSIAAG